MDPNAVGVAAANSGEYDNLIKQNTFNDLCAGCVADGTNGCHNSIFDMGGLEFRCNSFQDNSGDILLKTNAVVHPFQGSWNAAAGNEFASSSVNLRNDNTNSHVRYYWNQTEPSQQPAYTGWVTLYTTQRDGCGNVGYQQGGSSNDVISMTTLEQAYLEAITLYQNLETQYEADYHSTNIPNVFSSGQEAAIADLSETKGMLTSICNTALYQITADSIFDRPLYELWLERLCGSSRNYPLLESYYRHSDSSDFAAFRNSMMSSGNQTSEMQRLSRLYALRKGADSAGFGWRQWDASSRNGLSTMAAGNDYAAAVARSVRSAYYGEVYRYDSLHFLFPPSTCLMRNEAAPMEDSVPQKRGYESFFGRKNTKWTLIYNTEKIPNYISDLENDERNFIYGSKYVTLTFDSSNCKEINGRKYYGNALREDSVTGRLYRLVYSDIEELICDMSLNVGDTFYIPNTNDTLRLYLPDSIEYNNELHYMEEGLPIVADSVFYVENKKCIRFGYLDPEKTLFFKKIHIYFIEGVGPTYGPGFYLWSYTEGLHIVSCAYKDDTMTFMYNSEIGCQMILYGYPTPDSLSKTLLVYPNPAQEFLQVKNEDMADDDGEIIIVNALGMVMHRGSLSNGESRISLHGWAFGVYTLLYRSQKSVQQVRFVKE